MASRNLAIIISCKDNQRYPHLFGGGGGHVQSTAARTDRGGRGEGSGRADEKGGDGELHGVELITIRSIESERSG